MKRSLVLRITLTGVFSALAFVLTAFLRIPYAGGAGYFNFGDVIALFASMAFGPIEGMLVGMIGGMFGDLFLGYGAYVPFTLLAKGLMGLASGLLFMLLRKHRYARFVSPFIGASLMVLAYVLAYIVIEGYGVYLSSLFDIVQGYGCAVLAILVYLPLERSGILNRLMPEKPSEPK